MRKNPPGDKRRKRRDVQDHAQDLSAVLRADTPAASRRNLSGNINTGQGPEAALRIDTAGEIGPRADIEGQGHATEGGGPNPLQDDVHVLLNGTGDLHLHTAEVADQGQVAEDVIRVENALHLEIDLGDHLQDPGVCQEGLLLSEGETEERTRPQSSPSANWTLPC